MCDQWSFISGEDLGIKEDCYWYYEDQDMNARIPCCKIIDHWPKAWGIGPGDCKECKHYHSKFKRTFGDWFRSMNDYELAHQFYLFSKNYYIDPPKTLDDWVKYLQIEDVKKEE